MKWGDKGIKKSVTNPFGVPPPRTLATHHGKADDAPDVTGHVCCNLPTFETFLTLDRLILPASKFTPASCIRTCQMATYSTRLLDNARSYHRPRKYCMLVCPHNPYMPCAPITHAQTHPRLAFYCSPSGLSELLPARRISSVDNRLMAITELRHHAWQEKGVCGFEFLSASRNEREEDGVAARTSSAAFAA